SGGASLSNNSAPAGTPLASQAVHGVTIDVISASIQSGNVVLKCNITADDDCDVTIYAPESSLFTQDGAQFTFTSAALRNHRDATPQAHLLAKSTTPLELRATVGRESVTDIKRLYLR